MGLVCSPERKEAQPSHYASELIENFKKIEQLYTFKSGVLGKTGAL